MKHNIEHRQLFLLTLTPYCTQICIYTYYTCTWGTYDQNEGGTRTGGDLREEELTLKTFAECTYERIALISICSASPLFVEKRWQMRPTF